MSPRLGGMTSAAEPEGKGDQQIVAQTGGDPAPLERLHVMIAKAAAAQADMLKESTWVGNRFAEQARAIHYGEAPHAAIHGEVDLQEARALKEEGVAVAPLPFPVVAPEQQN